MRTFCFLNGDRLTAVTRCTAWRLPLPRTPAHAAWREPLQLERGLARWQSDGSARGWFAGPGPASGNGKTAPISAARHHVPVARPFSIRSDRAGEYSRGGAVRPRSARRTVTG